MTDFINSAFLRDSSLTKEQSWWKGAIIYQIYPRSFQDSNSDGIGDLAGITQRLPYLNSIHVDALWLSPFFKSPMDDFGYDVSNYCAVDPIFGTLDDFDAMVSAARTHALKIIIDLVFSHTSIKHEWFEKSRSRIDGYEDFYVWADPLIDGSPPNNWLAHFGGAAWSWDSKRGQYYLHNFLPSMPDLNLHNQKVQDALLDVMRFWLDRGVSGFRLDVVDYYAHDPALTNNPPLATGRQPKRIEPYMMQEHRYNRNHENIMPFIKRMRHLCDTYTNSDIMMVAEISEAGGVEASVYYTNSEDKLHTSYNFELLSDEFSPSHVKETITKYSEAAPNGWPSWSFSNHDAVRVATRWALKKHQDKPDARFIKMINALLLCLRGTIYIYQGQELGFEQVDVAFEDMKDPYGIFQYPENKGRDGCRTPMIWDSEEPYGGFSDVKPWLPIGKENLHLSVASQEPKDQSIINDFRQLTALRKESDLMNLGDISFIHNCSDLLAFVRTYGTHKKICIFNFSENDFLMPSSIINYIGKASPDKISGYGYYLIDL